MKIYLMKKRKNVIKFRVKMTTNSFEPGVHKNTIYSLLQIKKKTLT